MSLKTMLAAFAAVAPGLFDIPSNSIDLFADTSLISPSRPRNRALPRSRTPGLPSSAGTKLARKATERRLTPRHG